jgi:hypothetical protein
VSGVDPKHIERSRALVQEAMASAFASGHTRWWEDPRLRTPEQLAAEELAKTSPPAAPVTPMSREQILERKLSDAQRERDRLARKLEKKMRKATR